MAGKYGAVDPVGNSDQTARTNMLDMWKESIQRAQQRQQTPAQVAQNADSETRADLEQRIRNGQAPCPTCSRRTYQDKSNDSSVSFQAARHISASTAGLSVISHEHEHVAHNDADALEKGGEVASSSVTLQHAKCPECGRTYVSGGVTATRTKPSTHNDRQKPAGGFDITV